MEKVLLNERIDVVHLWDNNKLLKNNKTILVNDLRTNAFKSKHLTFI